MACGAKNNKKKKKRRQNQAVRKTYILRGLATIGGECKKRRYKV